MHAGLVLSAQAHNKLVKVVNNASGIRLAASYPQTGMQSPIEPECKIPISTYSRSGAESRWFLAITRSPIYNQGLMGSISINFSTQYLISHTHKTDL